MANGLITRTDKELEKFAKDLAKVMAELEKNVISVVNGTQTARDVFDSTALLNSRPQMLQALRDSGYPELAANHVKLYPEIPPLTTKEFSALDLPAPKFSVTDKETMLQLAKADLEGFTSIGTKAMDDLRLGLYKQTVSGQPFSELVATIKAATTGTSTAGSPLSNYAYTHANTALLDFQGEVLRMAGESIGFDQDDSLWVVIGPDDDKTRDVCEAALANPIRTREEWQNVGYFGGTPGGFNCRHQLFPYQGAIS